MSLRVLGLLVSTLLGWAWAQPCVNTVRAQASGFGVPGDDSSVQFRQALSEALAGAIAQTSGVYVNRKTELTEIVSEVTQDDQLDVMATSDLEKTVTERLSGTILSYSVLDRVVEPNGIERVEVEAELCLDQKIVLNLVGESADITALAGQLRESVGSVGWQIASLVSTTTIRDEREALEVALASGATLILDGRLDSVELPGQQDTVSVLATLSTTLFSSTTLNVVASFELSGNGIGYTYEAARQDALTKLANGLSQDLTVRFLEADDQQRGIILVRNISRAGNRFTLSDLLMNVPGVISVADASYEASTRVVKLDVALSADICSVAEALTQSRRIVMQIDSCGQTSAELTASRD